MHENVPVRFGRGRLDSLVTKGLAAYLIATRLAVLARAKIPTEKEFCSPVQQCALQNLVSARPSVSAALTQAPVGLADTNAEDEPRVRSGYGIWKQRLDRRARRPSGST